MGPGASGGDRLILVSDHSLQLSSAALLQSTWLGERTELTDCDLVSRKYPLISSAGSPDTAPCSLHSPPPPPAPFHSSHPVVATTRSACIRGAIVLLHPKRPAETRAQSARTPEQRLALPLSYSPTATHSPFLAASHTRCDAWLTRALQVPSIRLTRALFDRETRLPPLLRPRVLGIPSPSPVSVPRDLTFTSGLLVLHFTSPPPVTRH